MRCQKFEKMFVFDEICGANLQEHVFSASIFFLAQSLLFLVSSQGCFNVFQLCLLNF